MLIRQAASSANPIPGGVGTIHAGSALAALRRLEQLIQEAVITVRCVVAHSRQSENAMMVTAASVRMGQ
jgi:Flp pilus assembly CpaF family ATPase